MINSDPNSVSRDDSTGKAEDVLIDREMRRRSRRSFVTILLAATAGYGGWRWLKGRPPIDGIPSPLRKTLQLNEKITEKLFDPGRRIRELSEKSIVPGGPRVNGEIGLNPEVEPGNWRLRVVGTDLVLRMDDLRAFPRVAQITPLNCIEGWTTVARWHGIRLADFADKYFPDARKKEYVGLATPDGQYYVGIDAASAFHPQTLLCDQINNGPLTAAHGAPLRLLIPTKYGVKNLKCVGTIHFTNDRPRDYWAEQGYDWFAGL